MVSEQLSWINLSAIQNLRALHLLLVTSEGWVGTTEQISKLNTLQELGLCPFNTEFLWGVELPGGDVRPLEAILAGSEYDFRDLCYIGLTRLKIPSAPTAMYETVTGPALEHLHVELTKPTNALNTLTWLPAAHLRKLSISSALPQRFVNHEEMVQTIKMVDDIVNKHQITLQEIILANAWMQRPDLPEQFNRTWSGQFEITDVVLNTMQWP